MQIGKKKHLRKSRKEDVYVGPYFDEAPDLILISEKGFNLKGSMASLDLPGKGPFTGKHTYEDAFWVLNKKEAMEKARKYMGIKDGIKVKSTWVSSFGVRNFPPHCPALKFVYKKQEVCVDQQLNLFIKDTPLEAYVSNLERNK